MRKRQPRTETTLAEKAVDSVKNVEGKIEQALTCAWDELPAWQQDNHYIISGYRYASGSFRKSASSLFYFHNESVNVWSHLLGTIGFLLMSLQLYAVLSPRYPSARRADIYAFASFFLSAATCFSLSATCHLLANHSEAGATFGSQLDYLGIVVFILGSYMPSVYYGLHCHPAVMYTYWGMMLTVGTTCAVVSMHPSFPTPGWRKIRATVFVGMGVFSFFPIMHGVYIYGFWGLEERMGLRWSLLQGALYVVGTAIFALCVPERWYPGRFDLVGASHQIMHFCALSAAAAELTALVAAFDYMHARGGEVC